MELDKRWLCENRNKKNDTKKRNLKKKKSIKRNHALRPLKEKKKKKVVGFMPNMGHAKFNKSEQSHNNHPSNNKYWRSRCSGAFEPQKARQLNPIDFTSSFPETHSWLWLLLALLDYLLKSQVMDTAQFRSFFLCFKQASFPVWMMFSRFHAQDLTIA